MDDLVEKALSCVEYREFYLDRIISNILNNASEFMPMWHPLGFIHTDISDKKDNNYRLHVWPKDVRRPKSPNWPIHTHIYHLSSIVISGTINNRTYAFYEDKLGSKQIFEVSYHGQDSVLIPTERTGYVRIEKSNTVLPFSTYEVAAGEFHQTVVPLSESAITLVKNSLFTKKRPKVVGDICSENIQLQYIREPLPLDWFFSILKTVRNNTKNS